MYEDRFGLSGSPFRLNPDPKFFFGSRSHNKAMAYLHYGLRQSEGFIVITGEIGAGKSMLIGHLLDQLDRSNIVAANLPTSNLEPSALLAHILSAFGVEPAGIGKSAEIEALEDFLFDQMNRGRRVLLIVDEAQNLPLKTIEELRMLSNMDYDGTPLFQVFLIGQPEFRATLAKPDMEQLRQRVIATYHLNPLDADETRDYILHRLEVVGWNNTPSISSDAFPAIHAATGGLPRKINTLCNRIFLYCALENVARIDEKVVSAVVADMRAEARGVRKAPSEDLALLPEAAPAIPTEELAPPPVADRPKAADPRLDAIPVWTPPKAPEPIKAEDVAPGPASPHAEKPISAEPARAEAAIAAPHAAFAAPPVAAPVASIKEPAAMSIFDRLRALKSGAPTEPPPPMPAVAAPMKVAEVEAPPALSLETKAEPPPAPATLGDVARAIAEIGDIAPSSETPPSTGEIPAADDFTVDAAEDVASVAEEPGWRRTVLESIAETRDDLKTAHANVARLRRKLIEIDRRRMERRTRVSANLDKAENILAEIRNVWR